MDKEGQLYVALTACMLICGYFGSLRGEEVIKVDLGSIHKNWTEAMNHQCDPHVPLAIAGRIKGQTGIKMFNLPLAAVTQDGRKIGLWFF